MAWIYLFIAVILEIAWTLSLKAADGFTKLTPSILAVTLGAINLWVLSQVFKVIPVSVAYPVWTGLGGLGVFFVAITFGGEASNNLKLFFCLLVIIGVAGLKANA